MSGKSASRAAPSSTQIPRALLVIVVALIIVVVAFGIVPFLETAFNPTPNITIVNKNPSVAGCNMSTGGNATYYTYTWSFDLKNNGNTNANATVIVYEVTYTNPTALTSFVYQVPKASEVPKTINYSKAAWGCATHALDIKVQSTVAT